MQRSSFLRPLKETKTYIVGPNLLVDRRFIFFCVILPEYYHRGEEGCEQSDRDSLGEICQEEEWSAIDALASLLIVPCTMDGDCKKMLII